MKKSALQEMAEEAQRNVRKKPVRREGEPMSKKKTPLDRVLALLEDASGRVVHDDDIVFEGNKVVLPEGYDLRKAIQLLERKYQEEEEQTDFRRTFDFRPWDGAYAFKNVMKEKFGMLFSGSFRDMFGQKHNTQWMTIPVSANETDEVPWGPVETPIAPGVLCHLYMDHDNDRGPLFGILFNNCPRKYRHRIHGLFALVQRELETNSLYRGKAFDGAEMPQFMDLEGIREERVVYPSDTWLQLEQNIFSVFEHSERLRRYGIPLKRAVLLEGPYGTGKTIAGYLTAKRATENQWTFIYCRPGKDDLQQTLQTAKLYQPAVVFFEDVDVVAAPGEVDQTSRMLDAFDGIRSKGTELMVVLTTNHVDKLHKGMVRPGRLDGIIHLGAYDRDGVEALIKVTVSEALDPGIRWDDVYPAYQNFLPAFIVEAAQRAVRYSLLRSDPPVVSTEDLIASAHGLQPQLELMEGAKEHQDIDPLAVAQAKVIAKQVDEAMISMMRVAGWDYEDYEHHRQAVKKEARR